MSRPVRLQLSRKAGFNLQALSLATNGLPAVKVSRPGPFGNPFTVQDAADVFETNRTASHRHAVQWFRDWIAADGPFEPLTVWDGYQQEHEAIRRRLPELRGKNLACFCAPDLACHADVLLELANEPTCEPAATRSALGLEGRGDGG